MCTAENSQFSTNGHLEHFHLFWIINETKNITKKTKRHHLEAPPTSLNRKKIKYKHLKKKNGHFRTLSTIFSLVLSGISRSWPFPGMKASYSHSRFSGMEFLHSLPVPKLGNGSFYSLPLPEYVGFKREC